METTIMGLRRVEGLGVMEEKVETTIMGLRRV